MMTLPQEQLNQLKGAFGNIATAEEGGRTYIRIDQLPLPAGCSPQHVTALLCPSPRDGYESRLFFCQQIQHAGKGTNWNANGVCILGEKWWAASWKINPANKTLMSKLMGHLEAFSNGNAT
ncbi:MAG: hypothetical protein PF904_11205 [Kiritimatiellae bacterium]|jgi:hypothetical protein|nr:hypothetical protein [Kiritimatiellia bacterium]